MIWGVEESVVGNVGLEINEEVGEVGSEADEAEACDKAAVLGERASAVVREAKRAVARRRNTIRILKRLYIIAESKRM